MRQCGSEEVGQSEIDRQRGGDGVLGGCSDAAMMHGVHIATGRLAGATISSRNSCRQLHVESKGAKLFSLLTCSYFPKLRAKTRGGAPTPP